MHRCCVDGCPNEAAYEALLYDFEPEEGAVSFVPDGDCPYICVEHAIENERRAVGDRLPWGVVEYPHTNRAGHPGLTVYRQLEPALLA
jgi:hypothetical protein